MEFPLVQEPFRETVHTTNEHAIPFSFSKEDRLDTDPTSTRVKSPLEREHEAGNHGSSWFILFEKGVEIPGIESKDRRVAWDIWTARNAP